MVLFCISIAQNGAVTHLSALLTDRGVTADRAAIAVSAMGGAASPAGWRPAGCSTASSRPTSRWSCCWARPSAPTCLATASSLPVGVLAAVLIGFSMGGEADVVPYLLSRYFGLRSFSVLYALTWTFYAIAGAIGPVLMGKAFDATGSYERLLFWLAIATLGIAPLMFLLPRYEKAPAPSPG